MLSTYSMICASERRSGGSSEISSDVPPAARGMGPSAARESTAGKSRKRTLLPLRSTATSSRPSTARGPSKP